MTRQHARHLRQREADYLPFAADPLEPFANSATEREIRMSKLRIKVRLHAVNGRSAGMLDVLIRAASGSAWIPSAT